MNRRGFLKMSATSLAAIPLASGFLSALSKTAKAVDASMPNVKESDPQAKALNYCIDAEKAAKSKKPSCPARKSSEHAGESCHSCQLFTKTTGDGKSEMGKCLVMPGVQVYGTGWCNSFSKKFS